MTPRTRFEDTDPHVMWNKAPRTSALVSLCGEALQIVLDDDIRRVLEDCILFHLGRYQDKGREAPTETMLEVSMLLLYASERAA